MSEYPDDIFAEPSGIDLETLANLGPLAPMAGVWEGTRGVDVALSYARSEPEAPACPKCGEPMRLRSARTGPRTGGRFWGCMSAGSRRRTSARLKRRRRLPN